MFAGGGVGDVVTGLKFDPRTGLSQKQMDLKTEIFGLNQFSTNKTKTLIARFFAKLKNI